ncbi:alpha/beta hydrolase [Jiangella asiatica]|uniref:Alpha/beta hydrolase n=1 Tax=Jiangella asiatica TaxID=2530372 RepID=A0A4R5DQ22_9ACTN|nr:alpha/beta hydrolase [Jiangella asiatica]
MSSRGVLSRPAPPPRLTVSYGPLPEHVADVWLPPGEPSAAGAGGDGDGPPLLLVVHGGFWREEYDRRHARPQCAGLAAAGYVVAAIEYRRVGRDGGWPTTFDDVALAVDTVPAAVAAALREAPTGRAPTSPPPDAVLVGHSAGGHLAVWAASRHRAPASAPWRLAAPPPSVAGVVSLAGVLDLPAAAELDLDGGAARDFLGGGPGDVPERYAAADPLRLTPAAVPTVLVHGTDDEQVPPELSRRYAAAAGPHASLVELPGVEHFALIDPESPAWPSVLDAVTQVVRAERG